MNRSEKSAVNFAIFGLGFVVGFCLSFALEQQDWWWELTFPIRNELYLLPMPPDPPPACPV